MKTLMEALMTAGWRLDDARARKVAARVLSHCAAGHKSTAFLRRAMDMSRSEAHEVLSVLSEHGLIYLTRKGKWAACEHLERILEYYGGEA